MTLSNFQLVDIAKDKKITFPIMNILCKDQLTIPCIKQKKKKNFIVNLANSTDNEGTHWVVLVIHGRNAFYFDSFGGPPPIEVLSICKSLSCKLAYQQFVIQDMNSTNCGFYSIAYILAVQKGDIYDTSDCFIDNFVEDTPSNDVVLSKILKQYKTNNRDVLQLIKEYSNKNIKYY